MKPLRRVCVTREADLIVVREGLKHDQRDRSVGAPQPGPVLELTDVKTNGEGKVNTLAVYL